MGFGDMDLMLKSVLVFVRSSFYRPRLRQSCEEGGGVWPASGCSFCVPGAHVWLCWEPAGRSVISVIFERVERWRDSETFGHAEAS